MLLIFHVCHQYAIDACGHRSALAAEVVSERPHAQRICARAEQNNGGNSTELDWRWRCGCFFCNRSGFSLSHSPNSAATHAGLLLRRISSVAIVNDGVSVVQRPFLLAVTAPPEDEVTYGREAQCRRADS